MTFIIGTPYASGAGYFYNDDRASGGRYEQADVQTCPHCQAVILMQQWRKIEDGSMNGGFCMKCNKPVCPHCNKRMQTYGCEPYLKKLEKTVDMTIKLGQILKDAGMEPATPRPIFTGLIKG